MLDGGIEPGGEDAVPDVDALGVGAFLPDEDAIDEVEPVVGRIHVIDAKGFGNDAQCIEANAIAPDGNRLHPEIGTNGGG